MNWLVWTIVGGGIVAFSILKRMALVPQPRARELIATGAIIIDVRSAAEFENRHLPGVRNIPLDRLREEVERQAPDKSQAILLHCLSGGRSGIGKSLLKAKGYQHVFNLGSYQRAARIIEKC